MPDDTPTQTPDSPAALPWWFYFVPEQLLVALLFGILAPGAWGILLLSYGKAVEGSAVLLVWAGLFGWLAWFLDRKKRVRLWVSLPCAILAMLACVILFFGPR